MPDYILAWGAAYLLGVSLWSGGLVLYDKCAAPRGWRRIRERTLLLAAALGGAVAMLFTMRLVRHKTKHAKFMLGIPAIIVLQIAVVGWIVWLRLGAR
ncbi:MAG: DUF1294 domain-containing protein [Bacillota bacterium]|jgi:uncharacterized membrane protein YsdA (DUF1294 family)